jgi:hypothetical protein
VLSQIQAPILSKEGGRTTTKKDWNLEPSKQGDLITNPGPHCEKAAEKQHKHKGIWDVQNKATLSQIQAPILSKVAAEQQPKKIGIWSVQNKATCSQIQALIVKRHPKNSTNTREFGMFKTRRRYHKSKPQFLAKGASRTTTKKD